jgi:hypothetical protein
MQASPYLEGRSARVCINLRASTHAQLREFASSDGRSLSNFCALLLEQAIDKLLQER